MVEFQLLLGFLFSFSPVMELRAAIPVILEYCFRNGLYYPPYITLAILLNMLAVLLVFFFLDFVHKHLIKLAWYNKLWNSWIHTHLHKKIEKVDKKEGIGQYIALLFFVALPLPGTGVWTSSVIAWLLGLSRRKSFLTIALGSLIAGLIILGISLNFIQELSSLFSWVL